MRTLNRWDGWIVRTLAGVALAAFPATLTAQNAVRVYEKLGKLVVPSLVLEEVGLPEAVDRIRAVSREIDTLETNPEWKGVRIGFEKMRGDEPPRLITLSLENVSLGDALDEICKAAGRRFDVFEDGVVLRRAPTGSDGMITRTYPVPPNFLSAVGGSDGDADDPFAPPSAGGKKSAKEVLGAQGVTFPEGAAAVFFPGKCHLVVRNTLANLELVEAYTASIGESMPPQITLRAELYAVERPLALQLISRFDGEPGAHRLVHAVREAVEKGAAELVAMPSLKTRSGQRGKVVSGKEFVYVSGYEVRDGKEEVVTESVTVGSEFEIDAVAALSGEIDLNLAFKHSMGEPQFRRTTIVTPLTGKQAEVESAELPLGELVTAISFMDGQTVYVGTLETAAEDGRLRLLFVTATVNFSVFGPVIPE